MARDMRVGIEPKSPDTKEETKKLAGIEALAWLFKPADKTTKCCGDGIECRCGKGDCCDGSEKEPQFVGID